MTTLINVNNSEHKLPFIMPIPREMLPLESYHKIDLCVSGGIDSTACILMMLYGYQVPREKLRLVHFDVDGPEGAETFFDYPETKEHLQYLAEFFLIELVIIHDSLGLLQRLVNRGKFMDSKNRYCTSYTKRSVYEKYARSQGNNINILCISGERASESSRRSKYPIFESHSASAPTKGRRVDVFRPIFHLSKDQVNSMLTAFGVERHAAYDKYGMSRCSCKWCFFLDKHEIARMASFFPEQFQKLKSLEQQFGHTMKYNKGKAIPLCEFIKDRGYEEIPLLK